MVAMQSTDQGMSWSKFVPIEPYSNSTTNQVSAYGSVTARPVQRFNLNPPDSAALAHAQLRRPNQPGTVALYWCAILVTSTITPPELCRAASVFMLMCVRLSFYNWWCLWVSGFVL